MIQRDGSAGAYSMHSLVHAWSRSRLEAKHSQELDLYSDCAFQILAHSAIHLGTLYQQAKTERNLQAALRLVPHLRSGLQALEGYFANSADDDQLKLLDIQGFFFELACTHERLVVLKILVSRSKDDQHPDAIRRAIRHGQVVGLLGDWDRGFNILAEAAERANCLGSEDLASFAAEAFDDLKGLQAMLEAEKKVWAELATLAQDLLQIFRTNQAIFLKGLPRLTELEETVERQLQLFSTRRLLVHLIPHTNEMLVATRQRLSEADQLMINMPKIQAILEYFSDNDLFETFQEDFVLAREEIARRRGYSDKVQSTCGEMSMKVRELGCQDTCIRRKFGTAGSLGYTLG